MCVINCFKWAAKNITPKEIEGKRVIEVGSYDVNGSLRYVMEMLKPAEYIGVDMVEGPGVDMVCDASNLAEKFGRESFDVLIATCVLEHVKDWKTAVTNIKNICKKGGIIYVIVPSQFPYHGFPYDFWRYKKEDIEAIFSDFQIVALEEDLQNPKTVYAKLKKPANYEANDLTDYELYSIVTKRRQKQIEDKDMRSLYFRCIVIREKLRDLLLKIGKAMFPEI
ncbi:class I SAM-dependent methyltransferase [Candidatus Omnitrophota bacterium]